MIPFYFHKRGATCLERGHGEEYIDTLFYTLEKTLIFSFDFETILCEIV
jgi:hypothetical protein